MCGCPDPPLAKLDCLLNRPLALNTLSYSYLIEQVEVQV